MASLAKRKEKVNELRKAHFPLGFDSNQGSQSEYIHKYPGYTSSVAEPIGDRRSHFSIGSDEPNMAKHSYESEFKQQYPEHAVKVPEAAKRLNDENNIVFGFDPNSQQTNYKDDFLTKQGDRGQQVNQKVVHIQLGDSLTDFTTSYNRVFDGAQQAPRNDPVDNNLRDSNLVFGFGGTPYTTSNGAAHNQKPLNAVQAPQRSYATNVLLGADSNQYSSEAKKQFAHKESGYQAVDRDRVLDFKAAHFKMGFPEQQTQNVSEAQANYHAKPLVRLEPEAKKPVNVELRHDENGYFQSSYGQHFQEKPMSKAETLSKNGRKDNVVIGMGSESFNSEAKDQFGAKRAERVKGKGPEGSLELGDGSREYQTQYGNSYVDKYGQEENRRVSKEDVVKMRAQNFVTGFGGPDYRLHSMGYGQAGGETNKLTREAIDKMRGTNVVYGNDGFEGKSIQTSSYGWKKNDDF